MCGKKARAAEQSPSYRSDPAVAAESELSYQIPAADRPRRGFFSWWGGGGGVGEASKANTAQGFYEKEKKNFQAEQGGIHALIHSSL